MSNPGSPVGARVLLVGCGNMGFALLKGWMANPGVDVHVVEPDPNLRTRAIEAGATASATGNGLPTEFRPSVIVVAVKPQHVAAVLSSYAHLPEQGAFVVSVAAGVTIDTMTSALNGQDVVIRCMPNTPCAVGAGALVCCAGMGITPEQRDVANQLLSSSGEVFFIDNEAQMDAVTAVSGSGPAYVFNFIEALTQAAIAEGLPEGLAAKLSMQTVYGAGVLAKQSPHSAADLRKQVTSPNGTTAAALAVLMADDGLYPVISNAVAAAKMRSLELGKS